MGEAGLTTHITWMVPHISRLGNATPPMVTVAKSYAVTLRLTLMVKIDRTLLGNILIKYRTITASIGIAFQHYGEAHSRASSS